MSRNNYKLQLVRRHECRALPAGTLSDFVCGLSHSVRVLGVAFVVIAALLWPVHADALSGSKSIHYGTLTYSISNLDGSYKPGEHYTLNVSFHGNDEIVGNYIGVISVVAVGHDHVLGTITAVVKKNKTTSKSISFTAPTDGSTLIIRIGDSSGHYMKEEVSIPSMEPEAEPEGEEDSSTASGVR